MSDEAPAVKSAPYLHVMPRTGGESRARWHVFQISDEAPRITLAGTVESFAEARKLAARDKLSLRIAHNAWQQMVTVGVAPEKVPDAVTIA
jgi:hypothetical protein